MSSHRKEKEPTGSNRVLVDLPERLRKTTEALRDFEQLRTDLLTLYSQRRILRDSVVLDQIGERIGAPSIPRDSATGLD